MPFKMVFRVSLLLLCASFAVAQKPCGPSILPPKSLVVNWPQFQRDAAHSGCNPYESILSPDTVGSLAVKWQYPVERLQDPLPAPTVADGVVYGSWFTYYPIQGGAYALNASTGAVIWQRQGDLVFSSPAVANGIAYFSTQTAFEAVDAHTGALLWQYNQFFEGSGASPTFANGVVYVGAANGYIYAFNAGTGALIWKVAPGNNGDASSSPAVVNGIVYVGLQDGNLYALNANTGDVIWQYTTDGYINSSPAVINGKVYFGSDDHYVYAVDANTGALVWKYATGGQVYCPPAVANGVVYIGSFLSNYFYALNATTGALLWQYAASDYLEAAPAVANGVVYFASWDGSATALNASTGALLWRNTSLELDSGPAVANGVVYFMGHLGMIALHLPNQ